jgi:hypothetical protein
MEDKRFFLHPVPIQGELLSSWLVRIALMHRTAPVTFMNIHFPELKPDIWSRDIDLFWGTNRNLLKKLSFKSRISEKRLFQCTLQTYEGYLSEKVRTNSSNRFITSLVNRGRESRGKGLRFCPLCLKNDPIPFFRKEWRLSFVTTCHQHQCFLHDRCPKCGLPVNHYKLVEGNSLCNCYACGESYLHAKIETLPIDSYGIMAQIHLLHTLESGIFSFEERFYYSLFYFDGLKQMCKLIYNYSLRKGLEQHETYYKNYTLPSFTKRPSFYIENIPIKEQYLIFSSAEYVLRSLRQMQDFCTKNHIGKTELTHSMPYIPYWYSIIVQQHNHSSYSISLNEAKAALSYLKKYNHIISFQALSKLTGSTIEKRKRGDIAHHIDYLKLQSLT